MPKYTTDLKLLSLEDQDSIGQTFSRYFYLNNSGISSPDGFILNFFAFEKSLADLLPKLGSFNSTIDIKQLHKLALSQVEIDQEIKKEIKSKLSKLKSPYLIQAVTKNPSGKETTTFELVCQNISEVYEGVLGAWISFLTSQNLNQGSLDKVLVSVCISEKKLPDISGKAFILGGENGLIEIQTQWGEFNPTEKADVLKISRKTLEEQSYIINPQKSQLIFKSGRYQTLTVAEKFRNERKINSETAQNLAKVLKKIQSSVLNSIEIDFEIIGDKLVITNINFNIEKGQKTDTFQIGIDLPTFAVLKPIIPGIAVGVGKFIKNSKDLSKFRTGDIAVLNSLKKEYLPTIKKASGIIVENSQNFPADVLPKLTVLGITAASGTLNKLPKGLITLNGKTGKVHLGAYSPVKASEVELTPSEPEPKVLKTATKIFATLSDGNSVNLSGNLIDGIGPVRPEMFFTRFGIHPKELVNRKEFIQVSDEISNHLIKLSQIASDKPIIYQASDFKSSDLIHFDQGNKHETPETNPLLGKRGAFRHLENSEVLKAEFSLIKSLRNKNNLRNLWISLPFVRTREELISLKKVLSSVGLYRSPSFKLLVTISTPSDIYLIDNFIAEGIDGCLIDYFDLANLLYGRDFSYSELSALNDPAIETALENIIRPIAKDKLFSGIFNLPIEENQNLIKKLVKLGLKSVSVNETLVHETKESLAKIETQLVSEK